MFDQLLRQGAVARCDFLTAAVAAYLFDMKTLR
jgi:hypothetical protein